MKSNYLPRTGTNPSAEFIKQVTAPLRGLLVGLLCCGTAAHSGEIKLPRVMVAGWKIELVAADPELVTPVACCLDASGSLLVIESHTHHRSDDYDGPETDRIYAFRDSTGDGTLDKKTMFFDGGVATMGIVAAADGWIVVVTRSEVSRIRDDDGDGVAEHREVLATLKTETIYPHNGLGGVALGPDDQIYFGLGENFGAPYELVAADGSKQVGSGEGGSIFGMSLAGENLRRIATGFWNPFGICFDGQQRLWTVGNDPDSMPPCRLVHVVESGDYGFQFRFGRAGTHPLQSWNGQLPATLPYAAGTGEAPSGVLPYGDRLWVTSWGDNRIERYQLSARGGSWKSQTEVVVQGGPNFRPVGIAAARDGSIYITDWVRRDYSVHGQGRLWRLVPQARQDQRRGALPRLSKLERLARQVARSDDPQTWLEALSHDDAFVRQAAVAALANSNQLALQTDTGKRTPIERLGLLAAWRWRELAFAGSVDRQTRRRLIEHALKDPSDEVRLLAMRWAAERDEKGRIGTIQTILQSPSLSPELFAACVASISYLEQGTARSGERDPAREQMLLQFVSEQKYSKTIRAFALRMIPTQADHPTCDQLYDWLQPDTDDPLSSEIIRLLGSRGDASSRQALLKIATDESAMVELRADAIAHLSKAERDVAYKLAELDHPDSPESIRREIKRSLVLHDSRDSSVRPAADDIDGWWNLVGEGGDPRSGHRVFVRSACDACHAHSGRGTSTGPDLTNLAGQTRRQILQSILQPSLEIGPLYVPWQVVTVDGTARTGLKMADAGVGKSAKFQSADGDFFDVPLEEIELQTSSGQSIMPGGLEKTMSTDELRDLLAFLTDTSRNTNQ